MSDLLSLSIMSCKGREHLIPYLKEQLGDVPVAFDEDFHLWKNCRKAWRMNSKEWHCVIQDDAIICKDFLKKANEILEKLDRDYIVCFFAGECLRDNINQAIKEGRDYVLSRQQFNEVAMCMPSHLIEDMIKFCDARQPKNDRKIKNWARQRKILYYYTVPSLIEHRTVKSIYRDKHNKALPDTPRQAVWFIDTNYKYV